MALTFAQIFGEWVRRERKRRKWTQDDLAERANVTQGNISTAESARRNLTGERIEEILNGFQMDAVGMIVALPQIAHELYEADKSKAGASIEDGTLSPRAAEKMKKVSAKAQERGAAARRRKNEREE